MFEWGDAIAAHGNYLVVCDRGDVRWAYQTSTANTGGCLVYSNADGFEKVHDLPAFPETIASTGFGATVAISNDYVVFASEPDSNGLDFVVL